MDVNKWYSFGQRTFNIIHTKLQHNNSNLNKDLYRFNLKNESRCTCGFECENCYHFLWNIFYNNIRRNLFVFLAIKVKRLTYYLTSK